MALPPLPELLLPPVPPSPELEPEVLVAEPEVLVTEPEVLEVLVSESEVLVTEPEVLEVLVAEPEVLVSEPGCSCRSRRCSLRSRQRRDHHEVSRPRNRRRSGTMTTKRRAVRPLDDSFHISAAHQQKRLASVVGALLKGDRVTKTCKEIWECPLREARSEPVT